MPLIAFVSWVTFIGIVGVVVDSYDDCEWVRSH
jgi:hypothetical protein